MTTEKAIEHYTYDDYLNWEGKWELIKGLPMSMAPSPEIKHQAIAGKILAEFTTVRLSKLYLRLHELPEFERFSFLLGRGNQVNHRLTLE